MNSNSQVVSWIKILFVYLFLFALLVFMMPTTGHGFDSVCWIWWSFYNSHYGLENSYKSGTDYMPLYQYALFIFARLQENDGVLGPNIHKLKVLTLFFELASSFLLFNILKEKFKDASKAVRFSLFYFLNFAVLYNSLIWGQVDGILAFFVFASLIAAYHQRLYWALLCFVLAVNMKLQAIIFLPLFIALILPVFAKSKVKHIFLSLIMVGIVQYLIALPFVLGGDFEKVKNVVFGSAGKYPVISMNAYNMWYFFFKGNLMDIKDTGKFIGIPYIKWGLLAFFISSFFALFYLIKPYIQFVFKKKLIELPFNKVLISAALIPLLFFYFNTQMHERYSHPAFIFLATYCCLNNKPVLLILGSLAYLLNLEDVLKYFQFENYNNFPFKTWFISSLYLITILWLYIDLYEIRLSTIKNRFFKPASAYV